jgi:outer membrane receptor for ferrienterochelin and colicins
MVVQGVHSPLEMEVRVNAARILLLQIVTLLLVFSTALGADVPEAADANEPAGTKPSKPEAGESFLDMSIEELMDVNVDTVEGASKHKQKLEEAPASVTVITADEIRKYGYRTLADVLQSVAGFYINYDRNYHYLGVRGFRRPGDYDTRILLLLNGHRLNDNIGDAPPFGAQFPLDIDLIERVEVIRGPGSSLYGSNALLAVVNVITKKGQMLDGVELSGEVASYDAQKGRVSYGKRFSNGLDLLLSATAYRSDGATLYFREFDTPDTHHGFADNDDEQLNDVVAQASWGDFSLLLAHNNREKGIPTAPWGTVFGDPRTRTRDGGTLVGLTYRHELSDTWVLSSRMAYNQRDYDGWWANDYAEEGQDPDIVVSRDRWRGSWWDGEVQVVGRPLDRHTVTVGTEARYNTHQDQRAWSDDGTYLDDCRHSVNWGVYAQDEFRLLEDLALIGGVRHDEYDTFGSTNPRLGLIYDLSKETTVKALYGQAFRAPNAYELYYQDGGYTQKAALDLRPETIATYELILEQRFTPEIRGTASGFYYVMDNLIDQFLDPADNLLVFANRNEVRAKGAELALNGRWKNGWASRGSYSYVQAEDGTSGQTLVDSPKHLAKFNVIVPVVPQSLFAGLEVLYDSKARTLAGNEARDFVLTNLTLTYVSPLKHLEVAASVYNLLGTAYGFPGFGEHQQDVIMQDGRTFRVELIYRF